VRLGTTSLGVGYFGFEGDVVWSMSDAAKVELLIWVLAGIGQIDSRQVTERGNVRVPLVQPVLQVHFQDAGGPVRLELDQLATRGVEQVPHRTGRTDGVGHARGDGRR